MTPPDKIPHEKPFEMPYDAPQEMAMGKSLHTACGIRDLLQEDTGRAPMSR